MDEQKKTSFVTFCKSLPSWGVAFASLLLMLVIAYKIAITDFKFDFSKIGVMELISFGLAVFATALSMAFYFKATDTSNEFYDNTYKFTGHVSEVLGRIEERFGERFKYIGDELSSMRSRMTPQITAEVERNIESREDEMKSETEEIQKLREQLATRSELQETEKRELLHQLSAMERRAALAQIELDAMRKSIAHGPDSGRDPVPFPFLDELILAVGIDKCRNASAGQMQVLFNKILHSMSTDAISVLIGLGIVGSHHRLTEYGAGVIRGRAERLWRVEFGMGS